MIEERHPITVRLTASEVEALVRHAAAQASQAALAGRKDDAIWWHGRARHFDDMMGG